MQDGSMFAEIDNYSSQGFYEKHPKVYIYTPKGTNVYEIFSAYTTSGVNSLAYQLHFSNGEEFSAYVENGEKNSLIETTGAENNKDMITLFTCDYSFKNARMAVHGKLVEHM